MLLQAVAEASASGNAQAAAQAIAEAATGANAAASAQATAQAVTEALTCGCPVAQSLVQALSSAIASAGGCGEAGETLAGMWLSCCVVLQRVEWCVCYCQHQQHFYIHLCLGAEESASVHQ